MVFRYMDPYDKSRHLGSIITPTTMNTPRHICTALGALALTATTHAQTSGMTDPNFNTTGYNISDISGDATPDRAEGVALMTNGRYFVAGTAKQGQTLDQRLGLARYAADGGLQTSSLAGYPVGLNTISARACAKDPLANAYYVAFLRDVSGNKIWGLGLYRENLSSETQYGTGSTLGYSEGLNLGMTDSDVGSMATQSDGKVVLAGYVDGNIAVARFTNTGQLDVTFSSDGHAVTDVLNGTDEKANAVGVAPDGGIIVAGEITTTNGYKGLVGKYSANGNVDFAFGTNGFTSLNYSGNLLPGGWGIGGQTRFFGMTIQSDGKIIAVGRCSNTAGDEVDFIAARLNSDGSLDDSFGTNGWVKVNFAPDPPFNVDNAHSVALDDSGALIIAGTVSNLGRIGLVRVLGDGTVDENFGTNGRVTTDLGSMHSVGAIVVDGEAVIVVGSVQAGLPSTRDTYIVRYFNNTVGILEFSMEERLVSIYPNPITESTTFTYTLAQSERLTIALHDTQGRIITTFMDGVLMPAGEHRQVVTMPDNLAPGNYLVVFSGPQGRSTVQVSK